MSVIYGSAAAPVVYGSHFRGIDGSGYFSRKQLKRAIKYGSYLEGAVLGAPVVTAPVVLAPLFDVESRYYFEGGYRSSKHYAPYFHHHALHIGGIHASSAVLSAPSTFTVHASPSDAVTSKAKALLENFEGCEDFKSKMQQLERSAAELRKLGRPVDGLLSNWLFVGEPHTGKTTLAKLTSNLMHALGLLPTGNIVLRSGSQLLGRYVGESEKIVADAFDAAKGGVLFIDEADILATGGLFCLVVRKRLIELMSSPTHQNKTMVIMAGQPETMQQLMQSEPGLQSRFPSKQVFAQRCRPTQAAVRD